MFDPEKTYDWSLYSPETSGSCFTDLDFSAVSPLDNNNATPQISAIDNDSSATQQTSTINFLELQPVQPLHVIPTETTSSDVTKTNVKQEIKKRIQKRRRLRGTSDDPDDVEPSYSSITSPSPYQLSPQDEIRRERRKESNRRAATKCRMKKKQEQEHMKIERESLEMENKTLKQKIELLKQELHEKNKLLEQHEKFCGLNLGGECTRSTNLELEDLTIEFIESVLQSST